MDIFDHTPCELGEGAFWHPERGTFFWFDIMNRTLYSHCGGGVEAHDLPALFSAAGWIDRDALVLSGENGLFRYDLGERLLSPLAAIEDNDPWTRSNDGRTDPWGGFWASTMGKKAEQGAGSIYRYYRGGLRRLHEGLSVPNAICFDAARSLAYFADSERKTVWRQACDTATGWPAGVAEIFLDLRHENLVPDGAVTDAGGNLWIAHWGAGMVARYSPQGERTATVAVPATQASCPAFGGPELATLYVTTAHEGMDEAARAADVHAGKTFYTAVEARGVPAPQFIP
ncbi:SMP-30/gluconolactonase/LRE family protein [Rhizobiaceae bacterium BDR2-2]|uniref:SMP-30/gluconolactonase/LRE family protein n=1 Tax=Ectorhizobium quercum TaxID=2965071 RepID=A0AAE3N1Q9_9HYPH|nr:SMP-30/gluconolactonase/LRE family protein [Ectorhizobium quercum]MCX8998341.1 SMP-30/gluconolactonase/LRE family protein [Ectorhizobium quercum]